MSRLGRGVRPGSISITIIICGVGAHPEVSRRDLPHVPAIVHAMSVAHHTPETPPSWQMRLGCVHASLLGATPTGQRMLIKKMSKDINSKQARASTVLWSNLVPPGHPLALPNTAMRVKELT